MLAASADCAEGVQLLLDHAASLELQDALGRTALMFAAGNNARAALEALLDRGACVAIRDK
jgi:ankyrin repeat protein